MDTKLNKRQRESVAKHIEAAANLIETGGWCRGEYERGSRHCALGALGEAPGAKRKFPSVDPFTYRWGYAEFALDDQLRSEGYFAGLIAYNDAQRDRRKVTRLFRRTARNLRAGKISAI